MPNFLIIGAQKAGTTSLYHYLSQHPEVFMSPMKETNFFAMEGANPDPRNPSITTIEAYRRLFDRATGEKAIGEASPWYLYSEKAPRRIKHHLPDAKLIAILRDPAGRAYSQFLHFVREGREPNDDFVRALREEEARVRETPLADRATDRGAMGAYVSRGFYHAQLERYLELFDRSQILVLLSEDLERDPAGVLRKVFGFLGVDAGFVPAVSTRHNTAGVPKNDLLHSFLTKPHAIRTIVRALKLYLPPAARLRLADGLAYVRRRNSVEPPRLPAEVRRRLIELYKEDVAKLEGLIERDLSAWLR